MFPRSGKSNFQTYFLKISVNDSVHDVFYNTGLIIHKKTILTPRSSSYGIEGFGDVANDDRDPRRDRVEMPGGIQAQKGHHHSNGAGGEGEEA